MKYPKEILAIAEEMAERHAEDITTALLEAEKKVRKLEDFDVLVSQLISQAILEAIYDARHRRNVRLKNQNGSYDNRTKVMVGESLSVQRAAESYYDYCIAGTRLGLLFGKDLGRIAASEQAIAEGHEFNARLCLWLKGKVPDDKQVKGVVSERQLKGFFMREKKDKEVA